MILLFKRFRHPSAQHRCNKSTFVKNKPPMFVLPFFTILNGIHFVTDTFGKLLCLKHIGRCSFNFSIITPSRGMSADTNYICVCGKSTIGLGCTATAHTGHKRV